MVNPTGERPLRILQVHPFLKGEGMNPNAGGKSRLSLQLSRELALRGLTVAIFPLPEPLLEKGYRIQNGPAPLLLLPTARFPSFFKSGWLLLKALRLPREERSRREVRLASFFLAGLEQAIREFEPDVIHNHLSFSNLPLLYHSLGLKVPLLLTHHTHTTGQHLDSYRLLIFASEDLRAKVCGRGSALYARTRLIRPAVERLFVDPKVSIPERRRGILFVGGLRLDKGLQHLLAAYSRSPALRKIPLRVCGVGPEQANFESIAKENRVPVQFLGKLTAEQVRAEMLAAGLLVNPSPAEAFSLALAEAMCCGTPVIGWKPQVEETRAILKMECGAGFDPAESSADELAEWILKWVSGKAAPTLRFRITLADRARAFFSIDRYTAENLVAYDEVLGLDTIQVKSAGLSNSSGGKTAPRPVGNRRPKSSRRP
jgi:glycosyltransferase involved in cell wall biosynthesis